MDELIVSIGLPLAVVLLSLMRLFGVKPKSREGYSPLPQVIHMAFNCGLVTIGFLIVVLAVTIMWVLF